MSETWKKAKRNRLDPSVGAYRATPEKKGNCGRNFVYDREELVGLVSELPSHKRRTIRGLAGSLGISKTTIHRIQAKEDVINPHTNSLKPFLTEQNEWTRMAYVADRVLKTRVPTRNGTRDEYRFRSAYDEIHLDEKWFFITERCLRTYLARGEQPLTRRVKHKSHIMKVMFLAAVARPRFDNDGNCSFDGKIGIWPFVETVIAQRSSVNRPAGTPITKCLSVTLDVYKDYVFNKVMPAVLDRWPDDRATVRFQHDNAKSHFDNNDVDWRAKAVADRRIKFTLVEQPANSPDSNILDLGFFRAIQSLQFCQEPATTIDGLIANVEKAYTDYDPIKLNRTWLTHMSCMDETAKAYGDNNYSIPHIGKEAMERAGHLPDQLKLSSEGKDALEEASLIT